MKGFKDFIDLILMEYKHIKISIEHIFKGDPLEDEEEYKIYRLTIHNKTSQNSFYLEEIKEIDQHTNDLVDILLKQYEEFNYDWEIRVKNKNDEIVLIIDISERYINVKKTS